MFSYICLSKPINGILDKKNQYPSSYLISYFFILLVIEIGDKKVAMTSMANIYKTSAKLQNVFWGSRMGLAKENYHLRSSLYYFSFSNSLYLLT